MLGKAKQWYLDLFAYVIGVIALWYFIDATLVRAIEAVMAVERAGSAWNSPQPLILKTMLVSGASLYLAQLLVNLYRHFQSKVAKNIITAIAGLILLRLVLVFLDHAFEATGIVSTINGFYSYFGAYLEPDQYVDMDNISVGAASFIIVAVMLLLMMTGMPLGVVTLFVSIFTALFYYGYPGMLLVSTNAYGLLEKYPLVAVPLFVLMASILEKAGVAEDLFDAMQIFAGKLRGGVAIQTIVVAVILAAMSGVMGGEIVMLGLVALPQMIRLGYNRKLAIGVVCASGALATLIPPSIIMIVYGLSANVAIGDLFMAGAVPGLMLACFYAIYTLIRCSLDHSLAPTAEEVAERRGSVIKLTKEKNLL